MRVARINMPGVIFAPMDDIISKARSATRKAKSAPKPKGAPKSKAPPGLTAEDLNQAVKIAAAKADKAYIDSIRRGQPVDRNDLFEKFLQEALDAMRRKLK